MLSRRQGLASAVAVGMASTLEPRGGRAAGPSTNAPTVKTPVSFQVPRGACDCHVHVFEPERFPYWSGRTYTPPAATPAQLAAFEKAIHMDRVVIVTPSVEGTDNRATLDGIRQLGPDRTRGVAVIGPETSPSDLKAMADQGITGIRINLQQAGVFDPAVSLQRLQAAVQQIAGLPWHIQMYAKLSVLAALKSQLAEAPVPLVFDHFAGAQAEFGPQQPGFDAVLELVRSGKAYVKISGAYRASKQAPDYPPVAPLARALIEANPDRLVWGSDWPHPDSDPVPGRKATDLAPAQPIDDGRVLNLVAEWAPDPAIRERILVDNPKRLYGF